MLSITFAFLYVGYSLAWSGFGKLLSGGDPYYNLSNAFSLNPKQKSSSSAPIDPTTGKPGKPITGLFPWYSPSTATPGTTTYGTVGQFAVPPPQLQSA